MGSKVLIKTHTARSIETPSTHLSGIPKKL